MTETTNDSEKNELNGENYGKSFDYLKKRLSSQPGDITIIPMGPVDEGIIDIIADSYFRLQADINSQFTGTKPLMIGNLRIGTAYMQPVKVERENGSSVYVGNPTFRHVSADVSNTVLEKASEIKGKISGLSEEAAKHLKNLDEALRDRFNRYK